MSRVLDVAIDYSIAARLAVSGALGRKDDSRYLSGTKAPILLLPGVYEPWTFLHPIAEHLHDAGHPVHVVRALGRNTRPIPQSAEIAQRYVDDANLWNVTIVAHSKGGLIAKHMMLFNDTEGRIDRLIAFATPFAGSRYAKYFLNPPLRAFIPTEATLSMLAAHAIANARITSIYPEWDPHIPERSELAGATNVRLPMAGHFGILRHPLAIAALDEALGDKETSRD